MVKQSTNSDEELAVVRKILEEGDIVDVKSCPVVIKHFVRYWPSLLVQDGMVLMGNRTVNPLRLRQRVLDSLHSAHQGVTLMYARAEMAVFWPSLHVDLEKTRAACHTCRLQSACTVESKSSPA